MVTSAGFRQDSHNMPRPEAYKVTERIADRLRNGYADVLPDILAAFRGRAWVSLEFSSWESYCRTYFTGEGMLRLPDDMVTTLAAEGLSVRAIAAATGRSKSEVHRATKDATKPDNVISMDGYLRPAKAERAASISRHPAGKGQTPASAALPAWQMVVAFIADEGPKGYEAISDGLGWRDCKTTGAIGEAVRRGEIRSVGMAWEITPA